ncbi:methionine--tRNA ligase [Natronorubrum daqingense]|uniref:Methionine--tRNA ligase n=1 Tax=Natronorubrum daqingense TaxID=588898 RepID=A0A1N6ZM95_9EURY|nr:methionine--tRNA ligase [Natronorubrum daqingense]APX95309.1 methionine--tRNA ligase [Natronorubrum daqingense]SIR27958.1 methionyl-tRNA synthetase [Natronorubrum daqingense]
MSNDEFPTDTPAVVTCGLPYANGDLHIGHLRGYIGADAFDRALETLGQQTAYVCGSDMHGTPVAVNAEQEGVDPEDFALEWHDQYEETFPKFNVDFDNYGHTHDETNTELTQEIVRTLDEEGYIYEKEIQVAYDPDADQYLPDRYVVGTCPYCGEKARGDECDEGCQRHLEPGEVEDPTSTITGNPAEYRERPHKFFEVSKFEEYLTEFLDGLEGTSNARNQPRQWIDDGLQDWCITRDMDWGIDYPNGGDGDGEDLVLYVWVDAPIEYIASTKQYTERVGSDEYDWEQPWKGEGEIVHIIGRDIIQHHTIFWPAMLEGADYNAPRAVAATGFITINGKGLSTSRNRAIWAKEYLEEGFHPDLLRYYLTTTGGLQQDVDFSWDAFQEKVNGELVGTVGNFWYRSLLFAYRNYEGTPETDVSEGVSERIEGAIGQTRDAVNDYDLREVGRAATQLAQFGNEYIQRNEPWKLTDDDPEEAAQVIRDCVQIAKAVGVLLEPIAPDKAQALWEQLGEDGSVADAHLEDALEAPPRNFAEPGELFEKIEDDRVEELNEKLEERVAAAGDDSEDGEEDDEDDAETESDDTDAGEATDMAAPDDLEPLADERIEFEDFQDVDIRVGRIESAEGIEGADDLAKLEVDIGFETRQVVAGIKQLHDLEALPGEKCILLANMAKAELFGVESNGMILAAGEEADLLTTHGDAEVGERVR